MMQKKSTLGRGLADLLGQSARAPGALAPSQPAPETASQGGDRLANLPVDLLQRGKYQPRLDLRPEALQELADSIKAQGVVQPIIVRAINVAPGAPQRYEIIAGERRWRAAQLAGLANIPAVIRVVPDEAAIAMALIENIQRENLNPLEEARALDRLIVEFEMTHAEAAQAVGRSRAAVSNLLRLLELAPEIATLVERRELEMGHARALLGLTDRHRQAEVGQLVAKKGLSVRETEAIVRRMQQIPATEAAVDSADPNVTQLQNDLADKLGARVAIVHTTSGKGKLVVSYNSLDELDGILAHIH